MDLKKNNIKHILRYIVMMPCNNFHPKLVNNVENKVEINFQRRYNMTFT